MGDVYRWTHEMSKTICSMVHEGSDPHRSVMADGHEDWVLAADFDRHRKYAEEKLRDCETEMESIGDELAHWKIRALGAEQEIEDVRAEHRDDLRELRAELEAQDE